MATKQRKKKRDWQYDYKKKEARYNARDKKYMDDYATKERNMETNDPSWYAMYPELMRDAASLPYSIPTGTEITWDLHLDPTYPIYQNSALYNVPHESVPGIVTLGVVPTPGVSIDATSPINVASDMLYTKVRAENSGARNYDSPDLMLYCLAMDQIYSLLTWYNRIYGTMMLYSIVNRYIPKALLEAQHVNFDDLKLHINDFKAFLDTATAQAAVFSVPADMKLFNRHAFMYQNVYKDAESFKSQMYQFAPRIFYQYDENSGAGRLMPIDIINTYPNGLGYLDLINLFHTLMDPIISAEDFNIMSGDILKAFGDGNLIKLQIMPSGYTITPITDYEVLTQIKNATMSQLTVAAALVWQNTPADWSIHQDANVDFIEWNPHLILNSTGVHTYSRDRYLSTYKTNPEPADNMVYTRLMFSVHEEIDSGGTQIYFDAVGSEFICNVAVTQFAHDPNGDWKTQSIAMNLNSDSAFSSWTNGIITRLFMAKHFDYMPCLYLFYEESGSSKTIFWPVFDLDNWTIIHSYELEKMHRTALMSMLRVPMIGSALPSSK